MATINCPKCQRTFTHPKYLSKAKEHLQRHLNRANPCDGSVDHFVFERHVTATVPSIDSLDLTGLVESLDGNIRFCHLVSHVFRVLNERNNFAVWPNVKLFEVYYMDGTKPTCATPGMFMIELWNRVIIKQVCPLLKERWPRYQNFIDWFTGPANIWVFGISTLDKDNLYRINLFMKSEYYRHTKSAIVGHLKGVPRDQRFRTRVNMGIQVPETRNVMYVPPVRCSINKCQEVAIKHGVCEKHVEIWENTHLLKTTDTEK